MTQESRWVRPTFLSLAALFGLIVMVWGLMVGALGGFHIVEPRYGRAESDQGDIASAFRSVYSPLLELGALQGNVPPGSSDALRRAAAEAEGQALERAKDRGYNDAVKGALGFVVGAFVLMIASSSAKRVALRHGTAIQDGPDQRAPVTAGPPGRQQQPSGVVPPAPARPAPRPGTAPAPASAPRAPQQPARPAQTAASPVGRLQEAPDTGRRARKTSSPVPVAPKPAARRPAKESPIPVASPPAEASPAPRTVGEAPTPAPRTASGAATPSMTPAVPSETRPVMPPQRPAPPPVFRPAAAPQAVPVTPERPAQPPAQPASPSAPPTDAAPSTDPTDSSENT